ncbi:NAD(P)H-quinone oxidoreductase [Kribbella sandramycini]|uniref:NAD(P)H-quinone oxidoreductase n=1 Tax=Kribbella sandramycini TaxID=60450 RepID=A0A7Y4P0M0_9ACTN|nr:NAD(P)H-quinone oxidoreductase [Kribbella sandramycini]MBB6565756.1 putative PIG3 family NAD(P)H quinone oxidoreductase [Kribbella sandramycini]NOL42018.1 NAD(P)H-quinone oxidoreductase [Kribbella sandramycini]
MRAVICEGAGGIDVLTVGEIPDPEPAVDEVVIDVVAAGVNRADLLQRQGFYPPPPGAPGTIGLEVSGRIAAVGAEVKGWAVGDECCALLAGGGYAAKVVVPAPQVMPVPAGVDLVSAAALPEVVATVWSNVFMGAHLKHGETLLVHGGASGIGTMAIQLAVAHGARVLTTVGSKDKMEFCSRLGADVAINYKDADWASVVQEATHNAGADVILDIIGAKYLSDNVKSLAYDGRLVVIGMQGGAKGELDLGRLLSRRASVTATGLRARSVADKGRIIAEVVGHVWPLVEAKKVRPIVHATLPLEAVAEAHRALEESTQIGKILLTV